MGASRRGGEKKRGEQRKIYSSTKTNFKRWSILCPGKVVKLDKEMEAKEQVAPLFI